MYDPDVPRLWESKKYTDISLRCATEVFAVHRAVLCTQSDVFEAAFDGIYEESISGVYEIHDADPSTIRRLLEFLYTRGYEHPKPAQAEVQDLQLYVGDLEEGTSEKNRRHLEDTRLAVLSHFQVYLLADRFNVQDLQHLAACNLVQTLPKLKRTETFEEDGVVALQLVSYVYQNRPPHHNSLKDKILEYLFERHHLLASGPLAPVFKEVLLNEPDLSASYALGLPPVRQSITMWTCFYCNALWMYDDLMEDENTLYCAKCERRNDSCRYVRKTARLYNGEHALRSTRRRRGSSLGSSSI
ncbi:MAG: hypothetical protein M1820_008447 [Bogoriella megaspora]|nr:MAG: hypothetical protein M1820_008447 [Bogoriella megaspora]